MMSSSSTQRYCIELVFSNGRRVTGSFRQDLRARVPLFDTNSILRSILLADSMIDEDRSPEQSIVDHSYRPRPQYVQISVWADSGGSRAGPYFHREKLFYLIILLTWCLQVNVGVSA